MRICPFVHTNISYTINLIMSNNYVHIYKIFHYFILFVLNILVSFMHSSNFFMNRLIINYKKTLPHSPQAVQQSSHCTFSILKLFDPLNLPQDIIKIALFILIEKHLNLKPLFF